MGLPLSILWGNTVEEWVIFAQNAFPGIVSEEQEWYPLQGLNSVPRHLLEIPTTPPHWHPAHILTLQPIMVVTMPGVAKALKSVIDKMTHATNFKCVHMLHTKNAYFTQYHLNTCINESENQPDLHLLLYDTLTSRAKPSSNGQHSHCSWSFGILYNSYW